MRATELVELFNSEFSPFQLFRDHEKSSPAKCTADVTAVARSWNFLNDALLELVVCARVHMRREEI